AKGNLLLNIPTMPCMPDTCTCIFLFWADRGQPRVVRRDSFYFLHIVEMRHRYSGKRCWDWNQRGQNSCGGQSRRGCIGCSSIDWLGLRFPAYTDPNHSNRK